ncbi:Spo0B domain-containing protein [Cohnella fermenti]|nr:Spo0B domain-containing protein [Cohnella fermenti]
MSRRGIVRAVCAALSLILPGALIGIWPDNVWTYALFVIWTGAAAAWVLMATVRELRRGSELMAEAMRMQTIDTLKHHRHDWMNEIQLVYGYLKLNKPDKAIDVVERIKGQMAGDSRLSRLGTPKLAHYLLTFRTTCSTMKLDVEIDEDFDPTGGPERSAFADAVIGLVDAVRERAGSSGHGEENVLRLRFRSTGSEILLEMRYDGTLTARDSLPFDMGQALRGIGRLSEENRASNSEPTGSRQRMLVAFPLREQAG